MDADYNAVDTAGGEPIEELRRKILAGLPVVGLGGGMAAQPAPSTATTAPAASTAQPNLTTPVVSLTGKTPQQGQSIYDGVVATDPPDRGWLQHARFYEQLEKEKAAEEGKIPQPAQGASATPVVRLTNREATDAGKTPESSVSLGLTGEMGEGNAARLMAMLRGANASGTGGAQTRSAEDEFREALNQEPTREQFPAGKTSWLRRLGSVGVGALAGAGGGPIVGLEAGRKFLERPQKDTEQRFDQAHTQWEGRLGNLLKAAQLHHSGMEDKNLQSEIDARSDKDTDHAKLADSYADAVSKAVKEGRDPLQDPDVKRYGDAIQNIQRETTSRTPTETPFSVWRQQHPNDDVKEYFKLQPEARNESRPPKEQPRLTPGQKSTLARRYKDALAGIEQEFQERQSGSYVDKRSGELLPPMTPDELTRRKQQAEDAYKDELEAGGETVTRYDYGAGRSASNDAQNARNANPSTQHKVGDEVTYKGQRYRIAGIKNGRAQLSPLGSN
jgi:hypothetical protein